jgi:hypothetical protein
MRLSIRQRAILGQLVGMISFFSFGWAALQIDYRFSWAAVVALFAVMVWTRTRRCPTCGRPMYLRERRVFGVTWKYFSSTIPPRRCSECAFRLDGVDTNDSGLREESKSFRSAAGNAVGLSTELPTQTAGRRTTVVLIFVLLSNLSGFFFLWWRPNQRAPQWAIDGGIVVCVVAGLWLLAIVMRK